MIDELAARINRDDEEKDERSDDCGRIETVH